MSDVFHVPVYASLAAVVLTLVLAVLLSLRVSAPTTAKTDNAPERKPALAGAGRR